MMADAFMSGNDGLPVMRLEKGCAGRNIAEGGSYLKRNVVPKKSSNKPSIIQPTLSLQLCILPLRKCIPKSQGLITRPSHDRFAIWTHGKV
jgi:hypothetical protein